jgi:hypothetical protein
MEAYSGVFCSDAEGTGDIGHTFVLEVDSSKDFGVGRWELREQSQGAGASRSRFVGSFLIAGSERGMARVACHTGGVVVGYGVSQHTPEPRTDT